MTELEMIVNECGTNVRKVVAYTDGYTVYMYAVDYMNGDHCEYWVMCDAIPAHVFGFMDEFPNYCEDYHKERGIYADDVTEYWTRTYSI